jgi:drug/metabolite transporter (DMT)-like permease
MPAADATPPTTRLVPLWIAMLCVVWGSTWWAIRLSLADQPPLSSAALRFLVAGAAMTVLAPRLRRAERAPPPPTWLWLIAGATNFAGCYGLLYLAETTVPSGIAAVLWGIFPLLMAGSAVLFLGERLRGLQVCGFLVSFGGIVTVFAGDLGGLPAGDLGPPLLVLGSALSSAIGTTLVKKFGAGTSSVLLNRNGMWLGAALLAVAAFAREQPLAMTWSRQGVLATLYLALFGTALTFGVYFWLLRTVAASRLALITYVTPVLAMLIAALVGDGAMDAAAWLGTLLVTAGIALVVRRPRA